MTHRRLAMLILAVLAGGLGGCSQLVPAVSNPFPIATAEYDRVFDASVQVLRDDRFIVDRKDRRFGIITTQPLIAASVFEPWYDDNTAPSQTFASTLDLQRRRVRITISPSQPAGKKADADHPAATTDTAAGYDFSVQVEIDRRHEPDRELNTAAMRTISIRHIDRHPRKMETETGEIKGFWEPVGRDRDLEKRLLAQIIRRSVQLDQPSTPAPAHPPASH